MRWTNAEDLKRQVTRLWDRGLVLQALLSSEPVFPRRLVLKGPTSREITDAFMEARAWSEALKGVGEIRIEYRSFRHRVFGENVLPSEAWVDTPEQAAEAIRKTRELGRFRKILELTSRRRQALLPWIEKRPLVALAHADQWERFLSLIDWLEAHPRPGCYLRQVDLAGIDSKFIEAHRSILAELFDATLPQETIDVAATGLSGFNRRYGFRDKPERVRLRFLDPRHNPLGIPIESDITVDATTFASLDSLPHTIFITENETNFLSFPQLADSCIIFGGGYGFSAMVGAPWLQSRRILYWGDLDTHGFAILDQLRSQLPHTKSLLMDRETLLACRELWGQETQPCTRALTRLTLQEQALYQELQANTLAPNIRLEQERIPWSLLHTALSALGFCKVAHERGWVAT